MPFFPRLLGLFIVLLTAVGLGPVHAQVYVDADATGANDGSSWTDAYTDLQTAIDNAGAEDSLWVAEGVYTPASATDSLTFDGSKDGLVLYGGFSGTESTAGARDPIAHPTVLSGDVGNDDAANARGVTESPADINGSNANHVLFLDGGGSGITSSTVIDGVIITGGDADGGTINGDDGGGLYCDGSNSECSPTLQNVVFQGNRAGFGGALFNNGDNTGTASPQITNAVFLNNEASDSGGALYNDADDGTVSPDIVNTVFANNTAPDGGALFTITASTSTAVAQPSLINVTLTGNTAQRGGAVYNRGSVGILDLTLHNTIVWRNTARDAGDQVYGTGLAVTTIFDHSILDEGASGVVTVSDATVLFRDESDTSTSFLGSTNLRADPRLEYAPLVPGDDGRARTDDDGLHVIPGSPALDAGDATVLPTDDSDADQDGDDSETETLSIDLTGAARVQDGEIDIGAYEGARDQARTIHVDTDNTSGPYDGTSWGRAHSTLQDAFAAATPNDQIWVAEGTYYPDHGTGIPGGKRDTSFVLKDSVKVYGGFAGGESTLADRDVRANATVLSGEINDPATTTDNSYHVVLSPPGTHAATRLDGFTITRGTANKSTADVDGNGVGDGGHGGGMHIGAQGAVSSPTLVNLSITANSAVNDGGGLFIGTDNAPAHPEIVNLTVAGNASDTDGGGIGISANGSGTVAPLIANALFRFNEAGGNGGALSVIGSSNGATTPTLVHATLARNHAGTDAGGVVAANMDKTDSLSVRGSILWHNTVSVDSTLDQAASTSIGFEQSLVQGSGGSSAWTLSAGDEGGNLDADPMLLNAAQGDLRLNWASPVIGEGTTLLPNDSADVDYDGNVTESLPVDRDGTPRTLGALSDMGAYEGGAAPFSSTLYVDASAGRDTTNYGGSWTQPYRTLQAALAAARNKKRSLPGTPSNEIWVAQGTYYPDDGPGVSPNDATTSFSLIDSVAVYGGFQNGDAFSGRNPDPATNGTVLSGDVNQSADTTGNAYHVVERRFASLTAQTVLDGFTVTEGTANGAPQNIGGGILLFANGDQTVMTPTLRNLRLLDNHAAFGAGLHGFAGRSGDLVDPLLADVSVIGNEADDGGGGAVFGADAGTVAPTVVNAEFRANRASQASAFGVASTNGGTARPVFANTLVNANVSAPDSAAAVFGTSSNGRLAPTIVNTTWAQNTTSGGTTDSLSSLLTVRGSPGEADVQVTNSVLWGNTTRSTAGGPLRDSLTVAASVVERGWTGSGTDITTASPQFANPTGPDGIPGTADDSLQVLGTSAALNQGDAARLPADAADLDDDTDTQEPLPTALDGSPRVLTGQVDAGAYEGAVSPSLLTQSATGVSDTHARLRGTIVPYAASATVTFEYGLPDGPLQTVQTTTVSGTDSVDAALDLDALEPDTTYRYRIRVDNGTRTTQSPSFSSFSTLASASGTVTVRSLKRSNPGTIEIGFATSSVPTARRELNVRTGGTSQYQSLPLDPVTAPGDSLKFEATVPDSLTTLRGLDYYAVFADQENTRTIPSGGETAAAQQPRHLPVAFDTLTAPGSFAPRRYQMASVPAAPDGGIKEALRTAYGGTYDQRVWRLERWDAAASGTGAYQSYPALDSLDPGDGFWLSTRDGTAPTLPRGRSVAADSARSIPLKAGWTQIGSPFGFPVSWTTVLSASNLQSAVSNPVAFRDSVFERGQTRLRPWNGYFVFSETADTLTVPPVAAAPKTGRRHAKTSASPSTESAWSVSESDGVASDRYVLHLTAASAAGEAHTHLGLWSSAQSERDRFDKAALPSIHPGPRLSALTPVRDRTVPHTYSAKPLRTTQGTRGQRWTVRLHRPASSSGSANGSIRLLMDAEGTLPSGIQRYVLDPETGRRLPSGAPLSLDPGESRTLTVIMGTEAYAEKNGGGVASTNFETTLRGSYPNPFEEQATIEYVLSTEQSVTIEIYNVLGQRVRTLVDDRKKAGVHTQTWDGTNQYGTRVGSGVYFYRMKTDDVTETRKMVLVR